MPFGILLGLAVYFPVLELPRRRSIALTLAVAAALGAAVVYSAFAVLRAQVPAEVVENFVPLAGAWFIADSVTARRRYEAGLAAQAERERAAEVREERVRIAREMHDVIAHTLAVMTVQAGVGRRLAGKRPQEAAAALESIETIGRAAQDELRVVLGLLRDGEAGTAPLAPAPRLVDVKDPGRHGAGLRYTGGAADGGDRPELSPSLELSVYRVMQEALTNVVKHAPGARAVAELTVSAGKVRLAVRDDGGRGRRGATGGPGRRPRDRRDAGAGRRVRRVAGRRAGRWRRLPGDGRGPGRGCGELIKVLVADDEALLRTAFSSLIGARRRPGGRRRGRRTASRRSSSRHAWHRTWLSWTSGCRCWTGSRRPGGSPATGPGSRVLILTTFDLDEYVFEALRAGASGFALKSRPPEELLSGIRTVADGEALLAPTVTRRLIAHFADRTRRSGQDALGPGRAHRPRAGGAGAGRPWACPTPNWPRRCM